MKKPDPKRYLEGDITDAERGRALERIIEREVKTMRYEIFRNAEAEYNYERGFSR